MEQANGENPHEVTSKANGDALEKMKESIYYNLNFTNLPEFKGRPGESLGEFLQEFSRTTLTFVGRRGAR